MARLRYTLEEARGEAERLAIEYVKKMPNAEKARMIHGAAPSLSEPKKRCLQISSDLERRVRLSSA